MRCLQCGKSLPLLKRLSGGEFCSDAHRKEYQQEYTNLALSRLQQAITVQAPAEVVPQATSTSSLEPAAEAPAPSPAPRAAPVATPKIAEPPKPIPQAHVMPRPQHNVGEAVPAQSPTKQPPFVPRPQAKPAAKQEPPNAPAMAGALTRKPQVAHLAFGAPAGSVGMTAPLGIPGLPQRQIRPMSACLPAADSVPWIPPCEQRDFATRLMQPNLEMRSFLRGAPALNVALSVVGLPTSQFNLPASTQALPVPVVAATAAREAEVWLAPPQDLNSLVALSEWAAQSLPLLSDESDLAPAEHVSRAPETSYGPAPCRAPQPMVFAAVAAGRPRPVQVFSSYLPGGFSAHIPESGTAPLRPAIISGGRPVASTVAEPTQAEKLRKPSVTILAPEKAATEPVRAADPVQPAGERRQDTGGPVRVPLTQPVPQLDLGLPDLRSTPGGSIPLRLRKFFGGSKET